MNPIRVMSFNIRLGGAVDGQNRWYRRRDLVFEAIGGFGADVAGLQEVSPFQLDELLEAFPQMGAIADRRYAGRMGTYAPILFDKARLEPAQSGDFWLAPEPDGKRARGWDAAVPRICTWAVFRDREELSRFVLLNTHFDHAGVRARLESARLLVDRLEAISHLPGLVTADLNADEASDALGVLVRAGLRDTFRVVHPAEEAFTYHGFRGRGVRSLGKIDYVLCDRSWQVHGASLMREGRDGGYPSDHFPVTAELGLRA